MHYGARVSYEDNIPIAIDIQKAFPTRLYSEKAA